MNHTIYMFQVASNFVAFLMTQFPHPCLKLQPSYLSNDITRNRFSVGLLQHSKDFLALGFPLFHLMRQPIQTG